jgi:hypothetical protein
MIDQFALIGNIQHDENHGAVNRSPRANRLLGVSQNWIGGSIVEHQALAPHLSILYQKINLDSIHRYSIVCW